MSKDEDMFMRGFLDGLRKYRQVQKRPAFLDLIKDVKDMDATEIMEVLRDRTEETQ